MGVVWYEDIRNKVDHEIREMPNIEEEKKYLLQQDPVSLIRSATVPDGLSMLSFSIKKNSCIVLKSL